MNRLNVFASSGGGVRIGASFGAEFEGERQGKFKPSMFDYFIGTSAGALDAALTANGWNTKQKIDFFLKVDFSHFFTPFFLPFEARMALAVVSKIKLTKLAQFIDSLMKPNPYGPELKPLRSLLVNSVRADKQNKQIVFCEKKPDWLVPNGRLEVVESAFSTLGYGKVLTRSMVLPGLEADDPMWFDGGTAENPLLSVLPQDSNIILMHLGYAGLVGEGETAVPNDILSRAMYCYERKAYEALEHMISHFPNMKVIRPEVYDISSTNFGLSLSQKIDMVKRGRENSRIYW